VNAHFFETKRAFHAILRVTRKPLASFGLTAARYDMLYAICNGVPKEGRSACLTWQNDLPHELGVHKSVVSRMLRSLEAIGLVVRRRSPGDGRKREVELTDAGLRRLRDTARCLERASRRLLCMAIVFGRWKDPYRRFQHLSAYESYLKAIRADFGDSAWLPYRWGHPDD
jgi:DNA-binding MarR family transcriptional regulator